MGAGPSSFLQGIANLFSGKPQPRNDTLQQIERNLISQGKKERAATMSQSKEKLARELADYKRKAEGKLDRLKRHAEAEHTARVQAEADRLAFGQHAAEQHQAQLAASKRTSKEECAAFKRHAEAELDARVKAEQQRLKASEQRAEEQHQAESPASKLRAEELSATIRRGEEELAAMTLKAADDRLAPEEREQAAMKAAEDAKIALQRGIQPVEWPTKDQYNAAMERIEYNPEKLHIAVCGLSGSGKSSLVNAFRGLTGKDLKSAKVGVTETTSEIGRYPDPREDYPFSRFVWYDIPGAGTLSVPDWKYFNDQGLFVFDFLIVVYDARFTSIDVGIIENCSRFRIPVFIVRSKADQHILNMVSEEDDGVEPVDPRYEEIHREKMAEFVLKTRENFREQIERMKDASTKGEPQLDRSDSKYVIESQFQSSYQEWLSKQLVYIVSAKNVRNQVHASSLARDPKQLTDTKFIIDEVKLFKALLTAGASRQYSGSDSKGNETLSKKFSNGLWNYPTSRGH